MKITNETRVLKKVLDNGLTVLIRPSHAVPKVSVQLWYNVGSKDEKTNQKGIAHLIEHMIFKGTKQLSESDINMITQKLSGVCNAFTSYDYTGYLFDFPSHHWQEALPIMADCMRNCTFKQELLNSEMKAVVQELKMYRDNYSSSLIEHMISTIFNDHPYHYPIIGFKQDLWNLKSEDLLSFYNQYYYPNNATLVIVGDVDPVKAFQLAQENFGHIQPNLTIKKESFKHKNDLVSTTTKLYRDIKTSQVALAYIVPGAYEQQDYFLSLLSWILGSGKNSRLQKKLVDELQLVTELESFVYDLFDYGVFFIYYQPKNKADNQKIIQLIQDEIESILQHGLTKEEITRAVKQSEADYLDVLENNQKQAYTIGQSYLATGNENYLFTYLEHALETIEPALIHLLKNYFTPSSMHKGCILPLAEKDKDLWLELQKKSDEEDNKILSNIERQEKVEEGAHVHTIPILKAPLFDFPKAKSFTLANGLKIIFYHNPNIPKIDLILDFKTKSYYDPNNAEGLVNFMSLMLEEGTKNYDSIRFADEIESRGMTFESRPGFISMSMLSEDFNTALILLQEVVTSALFPQEQINKVRDQLKTDLDNFWDTPSKFISSLARKEIYGNHPYSKLSLGTSETLNAITRDALLKAYHASITPQDSILAIVGNLENINVEASVNKLLGSWQGPNVMPLEFPALKEQTAHEVVYQINRDQIVLAFAGLSVDRNSQDFDKLLIFDQIFTGGVLGSMSSRLFELRERSGLFYTIGGSLLMHTDEQPGMVYVRTIVSQDRLHEAEVQIAQTINDAALNITDDEYEQSLNALSSSLIDNFESNKRIAQSFLFLERFNLPETYFDTRAQNLAKISKKEIQEAVAKILDTKKMVKIRVGRI